MFDSDISTLHHYSTPITRSPPIPDTPLTTHNQKRPMKTPAQNNSTSKRPKPIENLVPNIRIKSPPRSDLEVSQEDEETDYIEAPPPSMKTDGLEQEDTKQFLESNGNGSIMETSAQDQGRCSFLLD